MSEPGERVQVEVGARPLPFPIVIPGAVPIVLVALGLVGLVLLVQLSGVTATGYDLRRLRDERADWERENQLLEAYVADLQSLNRVERAAIERLKMVPATERVFLSVSHRPSSTPLAAELPPMRTAPAAIPVADDLQVQIAGWLTDRLAVKPPERSPVPAR